MKKYSVSLYESQQLVQLYEIEDEDDLIYLCHKCAEKWEDVIEYRAETMRESGIFCEACDAPQRPLQQLRLGLK